MSFRSDGLCDNKIYAFLGALIVPRVDLMVANLGEDEDEDQNEQEDYFDHANLMASSLGIARGDHEDEEVSSTPVVASTVSSSDGNPDTSIVLSDRDVLAAYIVRVKLVASEKVTDYSRNYTSCKRLPLHRRYETYPMCSMDWHILISARPRQQKFDILQF